MLLKFRISAFVALVFGIVLCSCGAKQESTEQESEEVVVEETTEVKEEESKEQQRASPHKTVEGEVGGAKVTIVYGSPAVKERKIWGGLEKYGKVWRAGADETTSIEVSADVTFGEQKLPTGKYGVYIIPNEDADWVVIINKQWSRDEHGAWGAYNYDESHDVIRVNVAPEWVDDVQERLEYNVSESGVNFAWEKVRFNIPVTAG